jgi:hypothetical protein
MTPEQKYKAEFARKKEALTRLQNDFELYAKTNLKIKTKDSKLLPFVLNSAQRQVLEVINRQKAETSKNRIIVLKGRQMGLSTLSLGLAFHAVTLRPNMSGFIITQENQATQNLFSTIKRYYDNSHPDLKPHCGASNVRELNFDLIDSSFRVGTAGSSQVGRSATINFLCASELAFWPDADSILAGLLQTVPPVDGSVVLIESTANGCGNRYHSLWKAALKGESEYWPVFIPWMLMQEYRKKVPNFEPTDEELKFKEIYGLDDEQLAWRRTKVQEIGTDLFRQEYPFSESDAFLSSGRSVFDKELMAKALKECYTPKKRMILERGRFVDRKDGELRVWEEPKPGNRYVIGADPSEGVGQDSSSADVLEVRTGRQVAHFNSNSIDPTAFGKFLAVLGRWYNSAIICCESNNHGLTVNVHLRDNERYPQIYTQTSIDDRGGSEKETRRLGFNTNKRSKPYIIDQMSALFRDPDGTGIVCKDTILECQSFAVQSDGSYAAESDCKDDRVMSFALALYMLYQSPAYKKKNRLHL